MRPGHPTLPAALLQLVWVTAGSPAWRRVSRLDLAAAARRMAAAADTIADRLGAYADDMLRLADAMETPACPCGKPLPVRATGRQRVWCSGTCPARGRTAVDV